MSSPHTEAELPCDTIIPLANPKQDGVLYLFFDILTTNCLEKQNGKVFTFLIYCRMLLLIHAQDTCIWEVSCVSFSKYFHVYRLHFVLYYMYFGDNLLILGVSSRTFWWGIYVIHAILHNIANQHLCDICFVLFYCVLYTVGNDEYKADLLIIFHNPKQHQAISTWRKHGFD